MVVKPLYKPGFFLTRVGFAAEFLWPKEKCKLRWGFERWPLKCQAKTLPLSCHCIGIESDGEYNPPPCSSSDKGSSMEEVQITESTPVYDYDNVTVSEGNFVTEYASVIDYACLLQNMRLLPNMSVRYKI